MQLDAAVVARLRAACCDESTVDPDEHARNVALTVAELAAARAAETNGGV